MVTLSRLVFRTVASGDIEVLSDDASTPRSPCDGDYGDMINDNFVVIGATLETWQPLVTGSMQDLSDDLTPTLGGNLDTNSKTLTGHLIPTSDISQDLGSTAKRWGEVHATQPILGSTGGTKGYIVGTDGGFAGGYALNADAAPSYEMSQIEGANKGSLAFGYTFAQSVDAKASAKITASAIGAVVLGHVNTYQKNGTDCYGEILANGVGTMARGSIESAYVENSYIKAIGVGSCAGGRVYNVAYDGGIAASGIGSHAHGYVHSYDAGFASIVAEGVGSYAGGAAEYAGSIWSLGKGSFARGHASNNSILAAGQGSLAVGYATGTNIEANANNSFQFAQGSNSVVNSLQVGGYNSQGVSVRADGSIFLQEKAGDTADIASWGQLWVKNTDPCELWFTDDSGLAKQVTLT